MPNSEHYDRLDRGIRGRIPRRPVRARRLVVLRRFREPFDTDPFGAVRLVFITLVIAMVTAVTVTPLSAATAYTFFARELPPPEHAQVRDVFQSTLIYDRNGKLLYEIFDPEGGRRTLVHLQDLPPHLIQATLAVEDPTFYQNPGVDYQAIARALIQNWQQGGIVSGASTLTQQLARNVLFDQKERNERTLNRKIREAIYAVWLTNRYSKDEILEMYFNEVYYGHLSYGIEAASRAYFDKSVRDLTLAEAALLAGLPQAPSDYDPYIHLELAKQRQAHVLDRMVYNGFIDPDEAELAKSEPLKLGDPLIAMRAPHFVEYMRDQLERRFGTDALYHGGLRVYTTLDLELHEKAQSIAAQRVNEIREQLNASNSAVVIIRPETGEVLAMVGSIDYWNEAIDGRVNVATSRRMPGSTIKPFTYVTAFSRGFSPNAIVNDVKSCFETGYLLPLYCPQNFDLTFNGPVTLREALASSLNIPAVKLLTRVGVNDMIATAHAMGLTTIEDPSKWGLAVGLGVADAKLLDLVFAYGIFANGGVMIGDPVPLPERQTGMRELEPATILRIVDGDGREIYRYQPFARQIVSPQASWLITTTLSDDANRHFTFSENGPLVIDRPAAAKTGTSNVLQDTWTIGFTPDLVTGIWVGNANGEQMKNITSTMSAAIIWHNVMIEAHRHLGLPPRQFVQPPGVQHGSVCGKDGWQIEGIAPICSVG